MQYIQSATTHWAIAHLKEGGGAGAEGRTHRGLKEFCGSGGGSRGETRFNLAAIIDKRIPHFSRCKA